MKRNQGSGRRGRQQTAGTKKRTRAKTPTFETLEKRYVLDGLVADLYPLNPFEAKLDGQWEGSVVASDGKVYFGSSTHAHDSAGLFFQYDPANETVTQVGSNLSAIVGEDPQSQVPQGKLHSPIVEADGWLYFATHVANYWNEALEAYTGSHLIGYQLGSQESGEAVFRDLGIHRARFTTYSAVGMDPAGENVWWVAVPFAAIDQVEGTHLYRTNIATGNTQDYGPIDSGNASDPGNVSGQVVTMHVDNRGDAWVTMFGGHDKLFVGRASSGTIESFDNALPTMTDPFDAALASAYQDSSWWRGHSIDGERFIFSMRDSAAPFDQSVGGSLWEFDASKTLDGDLSDAFRQLAWIGGNHGTAYDDGIVYFVRRSDGQHQAKIDAVDPSGAFWDAAADNGVRLHLYSINLNIPGSGVTDWGMITDADDRVPWRLTSIAADSASGDVYLVGDWVLKDTDPIAWRTQRHDGGTTTTYTEHMRGQAFAIASTSIASDDAPPSDSSLVGYWKLDETGGIVAADGSGNNHDGTLVGNPAWTSGFFDGGLQFDGIDDRVDAGLGPVIVGTGGFSVAAWVKTSGTEAQVIIQQRSETDYNGEYVLEIQAAGPGIHREGRVYFWTFGDFAPGPTVLSNQSVNDGQWHHVMGVREDDGTMRIYIDGVLDASTAGAPRTLAPINVYLGADARNGNKYYQGILDDVRVYNRALDAQEATTLANAGLPAAATDDHYVISEDTSLDVIAPGLLTNDFGQGLFVSAHDSVSALGLSLSAGTDGRFQYDPGSHFNFLAVGESRQDTFAYTVSDGTISDSGIVTITIDGVNDAPIVADDNSATSEDVPINISVLLNDFDIDQSDSLSVASIDSLNTIAAVTIGPGGTLHYDPRGFFDSLAQDESTSDTFYYTASDGNGGSAEGTVVVTVTGVNDAPQAVNDNASTDETTAIDIVVLQGDTDIDSAVIHVTSVDDAATIGTATLNPDNTVSYSPNGQFDDLVSGETATDTFQYTIMDDLGATSTAQVTIVIHGSGVGLAAIDDTATTDEESSIVVDVLNNDVDGGPPAVLSITHINATLTVGLVTLNADDTITYDPNGQFDFVAVGETATDTFTYTISDNLGDTDTATVVLNITGVNDVPLAVADAITTDEDSAVLVPVLTNDTDPDSTDTPFVLGLDTSGLIGIATLHANGTVSYDPTAAFDDLAIGTSTTETFLYTVSDGNGGSDTGTVTVTITGLNEAPVALTDIGSTDESTAIATDVFANDSDIDSISFALTSIDVTSLVGNATFESDGTITYDPAGKFEHLAVGQNAIETILYTITDSDGASASSELVVTVTGVNDDPVAVDDQYSIIGDRVLSIPASGVLANDSDVDIPTTSGGIFFAAPDGSATGDGGFDTPWDLATLFAHPATLQPGDTVYLRGGTYFGAPDAYITGTEADPIIVRAYPGEHVRIDLYSPATYGIDTHIRFYGPSVHWANIEFMSSDPSPRVTDIPQTGFPDINRGGLTVWASHNKFINVISHDLNQGFGFWADGAGGEIYGSIIYNNGWIGPDRQHGHGIYTQNEFDTKRIADTVIFNQFGMGLHAFGTAAAHFKGFEIEGNVLFNNGAGSGAGYLRERDLLVGGGTAAQDILVKENYTYQNGKDGVVAFGLLGGPDQQDVQIVDNYFVSRVGFHSDWEDITYRGNTTYHIDDPIIDLGLPAGVQTSDYDWDQNDYYSPLPGPLLFEDTHYDFTNWKAATGLDTSSTFTAAAPTGVDVFVRPNQYEAGRGNLIVYNWDLNPSVSVDLSAILQPGDAYEIHNIVNLFGSPVLTGIYDGSEITLPMAEAIPPSPIGYNELPPVGTGPDFGVFIVTTPSNIVGTLGLAVTSFDSISELGASVSVNELGGFVYDPTNLPIVQTLGPNGQIQDSFNYTVSDAHGGFDTARVTVTVSGINQNPVATNDEVGTDEETIIQISVLTNDTDIDPDDSLSVQSVNSTGTAGAVTLNPDNTIKYDPTGVFNYLRQGQTTVDSFSYWIGDEFGGTSSATVHVTVRGLNDPPTAAVDSALTNEDSPVAITVLANDSDLDVLDALTITSVDDSITIGSITINPDGSISYDPAGQFEHLSVGDSATDMFGYSISDGNGGADSALVTITIEGANDNPVAAPDAIATDEETAIVVSVLLGDTDPDQTDVLTLQSIDATATIASISIGTGNTVNYDPAGRFDSLAFGQSTVDTFTYTVIDNHGATGTATVSVTVSGINDPPTAVNDIVTTNEDSAIVVDVRNGDIDSDAGDSLTVQSVDGTGTIGIVTLHPDGAVVYDPNGQFDFLAVGENAVDEFSYTIADTSGATSTASVTVSISGVNDQPIAGDDVATTDERTAILINVLLGDRDPDASDGLSVASVDDTATIGTVTLAPNGTVTYDPGIQFIALNSGQTATDFFTYQVIDGHGGVASATVQITIVGLDAPPAPTVGLVAHWSLDEGSGLVAADQSGNGHDATLQGDPVWSTGQLDGALDFDGDYLNAGLGPSIVGTGGFAVAAWVRSSSPANQVIVQQRSPQQFNGEYQLHLTASGHARFWTFGGSLYGPFVASSKAVNDGQWHHIVGVREDNGTSKVYVDGVLDASKSGAPRPLVPIKVYLGADLRGGHSFLNGSLDDVRIYQRPLDAQEINDLYLYRTAIDPGIAVDDAYEVDEQSSLLVPAPGLLNNDIGFGLSITAIDPSSDLGASVSGGNDGAFQYSLPAPLDYLAQGEVATDTFSYTVSDGVSNDTGRVTVNILGLNDDPVATDNAASTGEDESISIPVLANDTDVDTTDLLTIASVDTFTTVGLVSVNADGTIQYSPNGAFESLAQNESATDSFLYTIEDGQGGSDSATVTVTIIGANDAPVASDDAATTDEETSIVIPVINGDSDIDATDVMTVTGVDSSATLGSVVLNPDQTVSYDPNGQFDDLVQGQFAIDTFTYTIDDGHGGTTNGLVTVTINGVGLELAALDDFAETDESGGTTIDVLANDLDGGSPLGLTIDSLDSTATLGTAAINVDGTVFYDPNNQFESLSLGQSAKDSFTYTISNGLGDTDTATVTVTILGENDQPLADDDVAETDEDTAITIAVLVGDTDPDAADTLAIASVDASSTIGSVTIQNDGTTIYDPNGQFEHLADGQTAFDSYSYTVSDGRGGSDTAIVTITIHGVDEAAVPTAGLLAHWALDDGQGTTAIDDSGNGHHGSIGGNPLWSTGKISGALHFDGSGDHVNAGLGPSIIGTGGFTVAAWVRSSSSSDQVIVQQRSPAAYNGEYVLHLTPSGVARFWTFGGAYGPITQSTQVVNDGQWHHIVGIREDNGTTKIYIDGALDGSKAGVPRPLIPINVYLGADMRGAKSFLNGALDDVRIYNRALSAQEILDLASYQPPPAAAARGVASGKPNKVTIERELSAVDEMVLLNSVPKKAVSATNEEPSMHPHQLVDVTDTALEDSGFVDSLTEKFKKLNLLSNNE